MVAKLFSGATSSGAHLLLALRCRPGHQPTPSLEFTSPLVLDSGGAGLIWPTPPEDAATFNGPVFALTGNVDDAVQESAQPMPPTERTLRSCSKLSPSSLAKLRDRGAKMMVYRQRPHLLQRHHLV